MFILAGERMLGRLEDVLHRHQTAQRETVVDHQNALQPVLVQQRAGFLGAGAFLDVNQALARGHDGAYRGVQIGFEAVVAVGDYADHLALIDHGKARYLVLLRQRE